MKKIWLHQAQASDGDDVESNQSSSQLTSQSESSSQKHAPRIITIHPSLAQSQPINSAPFVDSTTFFTDSSLHKNSNASLMHPTSDEALSIRPPKYKFKFSGRDGAPLPQLGRLQTQPNITLLKSEPPTASAQFPIEDHQASLSDFSRVSQTIFTPSFSQESHDPQKFINNHKDFDGSSLLCSLPPLLPISPSTATTLSKRTFVPFVSSAEASTAALSSESTLPKFDSGASSSIIAKLESTSQPSLDASSFTSKTEPTSSASASQAFITRIDPRASTLSSDTPPNNSAYTPSTHDAGPTAIKRMRFTPATALSPTPTPSSMSSAFAPPASSSIGSTISKPDAPPQRPRAPPPPPTQSQLQSQSASRAATRATPASLPRRPSVTPSPPPPPEPVADEALEDEESLVIGRGGSTARGGPKNSGSAGNFSDKAKRMMVYEY